MTAKQLHFQHDALLGVFEKKILERIDNETEALKNGRAVDFTDYKKRAERIATWNRCLEDLREVVKTYLKEDEDDD